MCGSAVGPDYCFLVIEVTGGGVRISQISGIEEIQATTIFFGPPVVACFLCLSDRDVWTSLYSTLGLLFASA